MKERCLMKDSIKQDYKKIMSRIQNLCLLDDDFMSKCFENYAEGAQLILRIILEKEDLLVHTVRTQYSIKNLQGHCLVMRHISYM